MTISLTNPAEDEDKVINDRKAAELLGFATVKPDPDDPAAPYVPRSTEEAPSRRVIGEALGMDPEGLPGSPNPRTHCNSERAFRKVVNDALGVKAPRNPRYTGLGGIAWIKPYWNLPTTYILHEGTTLLAADHQTTAYKGVLPVGTPLVYRIRANTSVGQAQAVTLGVAANTGAVGSAAYTVRENGPNVLMRIAGNVQGPDRTEAQVQWARWSFIQQRFITHFRTPTPPGEQRTFIFSLNLGYEAGRHGETEPGAGYVVALKMYVAYGRPVDIPNNDYDLVADGSLTVNQIPASQQ